MPFVPNPQEARRLREAIDRASLSEVERIFWLFAFAGLCALEGIMLAARTWSAVLIGALGAFGGSALLYWRLRGGYMADTDPELHGIGLRTEAQRAFTALMLRQAFTGRNALRPKRDHDPFATWNQRLERAQVSEDADA